MNLQDFLQKIDTKVYKKHDKNVLKGIIKKDIFFFLQTKYNIRRSDILLDAKSIILSQIQLFELNKIVNNYPVEYLIGEIEFFDNKFAILPKVLIPREDTICLIQTAIEAVKNCQKNKTNTKVNTRVIEIGSGSGAVMLSIAINTFNTSLCGVEIFKTAYQNTKLNIALHGLKNRCVVSKNDIFKFNKHRGFCLENADIIVSNPPYIKQKSFASLQQSVKCFESKTALIGGVSGLEFYIKTLNLLAKKAKKKSDIIFEIGFDISQALQNAIKLHYKGIFKIKNIVVDDNNIKRVFWIKKI